MSLRRPTTCLVLAIVTAAAACGGSAASIDDGTDPTPSPDAPDRRNERDADRASRGGDESTAPIGRADQVQDAGPPMGPDGAPGDAVKDGAKVPNAYCTALVPCCAKLDLFMGATCSIVASSNAGLQCAAALVTFKCASRVGGSTSGGTGAGSTGGGSGTGGGSTSGDSAGSTGGSSTGSGGTGGGTSGGTTGASSGGTAGGTNGGSNQGPWCRHLASCCLTDPRVTNDPQCRIDGRGTNERACRIDVESYRLNGKCM